MTETNIQKQAIEFSQEWYDFDSLPNFGSYKFNAAAGNSVALVYSIATTNIRNIWKNRIQMQVSKSTPTAYIDLEKGIIVVSANFFSPDFYNNLFDDVDSETLNHLAIGLINGCVVHEALHAKFTAPSVSNLSYFIQISNPMEFKRLERNGFDLRTQALSFNIIEDLYIEARVSKNVEGWLQIASDFLFSESDVEARAATYKQEPTFVNYMNLCIAYKNKNHRNHEGFDLLTDEQKEILDDSLNSGITARGRLELSRDLLDAFEAPEGNEKDSLGEGESTNEDESSDETDGNESSEGKADQAESEKGEENSGEDFSKAADETEELSDNEVESINADVKDATEETAEEKTGEYKFKDVSWRKIVEVDVMDARERSKHTRMEKTIDFSFVQELVSKRTINRVPGAARRTGSTIVKSRMSRIATDGKIFAKRDSERATAKRIEVIINVDFSSSTYSGNVFGKEMTSAFEMSKALKKARIAHSVYGQTSINGNEIPVVYHIFSYDMQVTNNNHQERFEKACSIQLIQNYDGVAINYLSQKFTGKDAQKYMICLSDGCPSAPSYWGGAARKHTMDAIKSTREQKVSVISLSVVDDVVEDNDSIYGKQWNLDASRNVSSAFKKLLRGVV